MIEFTSLHENGHETVSHVRVVLADRRDQAEREEWIDARIAVGEPTVRNGAILRVKALKKVRDELERLIKDFETVRDQSGLEP
jgi:hypothetical protein